MKSKRMSSLPPPFILVIAWFCCMKECSSDSSCNGKTLEPEAYEQLIRLHSDDSWTDGNSSAWGDNSSGRVEVYWKGEWRGVVLGSIRTTREVNKICEHLGFPEGAESISSSFDDEAPNSVFCCLDALEDGISYNCTSPPFVENCFINFNHTTMIKCKTFSYFSPEVIALVILVPLLLSVISILVIIYLRGKVKKSDSIQPHSITAEPELHEVPTRRCVAYDMVEKNDTPIQDQALHTIRGKGIQGRPAFDSLSLGYVSQGHDDNLLCHNKTKSLESLLAKKKKKKKKFRINQSELRNAPIGIMEPESPIQRKLLRSSSVEWNHNFFLQDVKQATLKRENQSVATAREVSLTCATVNDLFECSITDSDDYVKV